MPRRKDIQSILILGAGPIVIGQACEFDYSGTQACQALKEGMISALTSIPVLGVPIESKKLKGLDSLLSIAQMPKGIPVGTLAIGEDGAVNAALLAASIIGINDLGVKKKLDQWRSSQSKAVKKKPK